MILAKLGLDVRSGSIAQARSGFSVGSERRFFTKVGDSKAKGLAVEMLPIL